MYTFDLNVVGGEKDKVTTKAKTNCAESIATTSKPTGLQIKTKIKDMANTIFGLFPSLLRFLS